MPPLRRQRGHCRLLQHIPDIILYALVPLAVLLPLLRGEPGKLGGGKVLPGVLQPGQDRPGCCGERDLHLFPLPAGDAGLLYSQQPPAPQALEQHGEVDALVYGGVEDDGVRQTSLRRLPVEKRQYADGRAYLLEHYRTQNMNVEAWLYGYRREFLLSNRLSFREGILHEDVEFTPRALLACREILELPDCLYHYIVRENSICTQKDRTKNIRDLFQTLRELDVLAEQQEEELCRWMKNALLNSFLNMVQDARMYQPQYRMLLDKRFLKGKAATGWNRFRVMLCMLNVKWYCLVNDCYKRMAAGLEVRKRRKG